MTDKKPNALRLADELENGCIFNNGPLVFYGWEVSDFFCPWEEAASELRRLHAENMELLEALRNFVAYRDKSPNAPYRDPKSWLDGAYKRARAVIVKAEGDKS